MSMLEQIREKERKSHAAMYSGNTLYKEGSWLKKPVRTILEIIPHFKEHAHLCVLDLGCGVGRNAIAVAQHFQNRPCAIDCVDILDLAIDKLKQYAAEFGVSQNITGIVSAIEDYAIAEDHYDWIIAVSALEHVDTTAVLIRKLHEIKNGIRANGIVCLVINSNVREFDKSTYTPVPAQFEVNLPANELQELLHKAFGGWEILKSTVLPQQYDIPRESTLSELHTDVVTFVAKK